MNQSQTNNQKLQMKSNKYQTNYKITKPNKRKEKFLFFVILSLFGFCNLVLGILTTGVVS